MYLTKDQLKLLKKAHNPREVQVLALLWEIEARKLIDYWYSMRLETGTTVMTEEISPEFKEREDMFWAKIKLKVLPFLTINQRIKEINKERKKRGLKPLPYKRILTLPEVVDATGISAELILRVIDYPSFFQIKNYDKEKLKQIVKKYYNKWHNIKKVSDYLGVSEGFVKTYLDEGGDKDEQPEKMV